MKKVILSIILASSLFAEQSVYSDSDFVDSSTIAKKNSREIFVLKQKISQLKQQIEGLKSIINGQADEIAQLKQKTNNNLEDIINKLSQRVAVLESKPAQVIKERVVEKEESSKSVEVASIKQPTKTKEPKVEPQEKPKSNKEIYKDSVLNFTKNRLTKAEKGFKKLYNKNYKKASSAFYLGEIAYNKKRYKSAISYYQESATLNDSASYMDKLLLHTAIALAKKGKKKEAKIFLNALINGYPDSSSVSEAKNYLKKLK